ncbi:hypothetical protein [Sedimenticola selenatireducens]|uniref:hypothetical protein n=1 Tax=Sedimenticola selenatireducens TaxID=191960 RepID=UPI000491173E|nr:hypothetical protein [Sedimenticola selenatireducens]
MSKTETSEADSDPKTPQSSALLITILLVISIVLSLLFIAFAVGSILLSAGTVGLWPLVKDWVENPIIKLGIALSFLSFGVVLFHIKSGYPRFFIFLEIVFAVTLAWVALGESDASRLTVSLAIAATAFATADIVKGLQSLGGSSTETTSFNPSFGFDRNNIRVYQGEKLICTIPKGINNAAYKIDLEKLQQRIKVLEDRPG